MFTPVQQQAINRMYRWVEHYKDIKQLMLEEEEESGAVSDDSYPDDDSLLALSAWPMELYKCINFIISDV